MDSSQNTNTLSWVDNFFSITFYKTTFLREVGGGVATYLAMVYVVFVNPNILSQTGMDKSALIVATCLSAGIGTLLAGFVARAPMGLAPGMGINAFFTYSVVLGQGVSWQVGLGIVFISGFFFLLLTLTGIRKKIVEAIPKELTISLTVGIGLFISLIGLKGMGVITANEATGIGLGTFTPQTILAISAFFLIAILEVYKVQGAILISIIVTTIVALLTGVVTFPDQFIAMPASLAPIALKLDILGALRFSLIGILFSFLFVDMFDSLATLLSFFRMMDIKDPEQKRKLMRRSLVCDAAATVTGSLLGTSTVTTYTESGVGISSGARTGLASVVTGILFLLTLFFAPFVAVVPSYIASSALVMVGVMMFKTVLTLDLKETSVTIPAFLTIFLMPLTYSINIGMSVGFISYALINTLMPKGKKISWIFWIVVALCVLNLIYL